MHRDVWLNYDPNMMYTSETKRMSCGSVRAATHTTTGLMPSGFFKTDPFIMFSNWHCWFLQHTHTLWRVCVEHMLLEPEDENFTRKRLKAYRFAVLKMMVANKTTKTFIMLLMQVWSVMTREQVEKEYGGPLPENMVKLIMRGTSKQLDTRSIDEIKVAQHHKALSVQMQCSKVPSERMHDFMLRTQKFDGENCQCAICIDMSTKLIAFEKEWEESKARLVSLPCSSDIIYIVDVMLRNAEYTCQLTDEQLDAHNKRLLDDAIRMEKNVV